MELKVSAISIPEAITFNYEELKTELLQKASFYSTLVYTPDQIKEAKTDRANLNRLKKALNDERLKREREYMKPFDDFKAKINEIISIIDKPASVIDQQIKAAEERQKEEKREMIHGCWLSILSADRIPAGICFDQVFNEKWLNASVSMKSIQEEMEAKVAQIEKDLAVIENLPSYAFEAKQMYLSTLDLAKAVSEAHRLQEMAEKKAAFEAEQARKKAEAEAEAAATPPDFSNLNPGDSVSFAGATETAEDLPTEPLREWVRFQALMTVDEAKALGQYMRSHGIKYKSV